MQFHRNETLGYHAQGVLLWSRNPKSDFTIRPSQAMISNCVKAGEMERALPILEEMAVLRITSIFANSAVTV